MGLDQMGLDKVGRPRMAKGKLSFSVMLTGEYHIESVVY